MTKSFFIFAAVLLNTTLSPAAGTRPFLVVLDPGHGGSDYGAVYEEPRTGGVFSVSSAKSSRARFAEKDATLRIALETAERLRARGIQVKLTRVDDRELTVPSRTALANRLGADLFISIHMNSPQHERGHEVRRASAEGIETFILNHTTDASARRLAQLENAVLGGSPDIQKLTLTQAHPAALNPSMAAAPPPTATGAPGAAYDSGASNEVGLILKDLQLDANLTESKHLACLVHQSLITQTQAKDRGVKQGLFYVLLGADMPSILVEAGFLSNARDRTRVQSVEGVRKIAGALTQSVDSFRALRAQPSNRRQALLALSNCKVH